MTICRCKSPKAHICPKHLNAGVAILRAHLIRINPSWGDLNVNQVWVRIRRRARQQHRKPDHQLVLQLISKAAARAAQMAGSAA